MVGYGSIDEVTNALEFAVSQHDYVAGNSSPRPTLRGLADRLGHDVRHDREAACL